MAKYVPKIIKDSQELERVKSKGSKYVPAIIKQTRGEVITPTEGEPSDIGFGQRIKASFVDDPNIKKQLLLEKLLPDVPAEQRSRMIGEVGGKTVYYDPKDQQYHEVPGEWIESFTAEMIGQSPTIAGDVVGSLGGFALGGPAGAPFGAGVGGSVGEYTRQKIGEQFFDDPVDVGKIGAEGAYAAGGEAAFGVLPLIFRKRRLARDIGRLDEAATSDLKAKAEEYGIPLTPGELTGLRSLIQKQKLIAQRADEAGDIMGDFAEDRNMSIYNAVNDYLDTVSLENSALEGNLKGARAAKQYIDNLKKKRGDKADKLYDIARQEEAEVNAEDIISRIDEAVPKLASREKRALLRAKKELLADGGSKQSGKYKSDIESLDNVKKALGDQIESAKRSGRNYQAKLLKDEVRDPLVAKMDEVSTNYNKARTEFAKDSEPIERAEKGILGSLADVKEEQAQRAGKMLFASEGSSPELVKTVKSAIKSEDPDAWRALLRGHIQDALERKTKDIQDGGNLGWTTYKTLYGSPKQRKIWRAALDDREWKAFNDLMDILRATGKTSKSESWTAAMGEAGQQMRMKAGNIPGWIARLMFTPLGTGQRIAGAISQVEMEKYTTAIAKAFTDPEGIHKLKELKKLSKGQEQRQIGLGALLGEMVGLSLGEMTGGDIPMRKNANYINYIKENY